jgi:hypothetical protein
LNELQSKFEFPEEFAITYGKRNKTTGKVVGIVANLVMVEFDGPVSQNEICFILLKEESLMAEVIKLLERSPMFRFLKAPAD